MKQRIPLSSILALILIGAAGCGHKTERVAVESLPAASVRVQTVESKTRPATEDVVGTVREKLRAAIESKISGKIESLLVVPGQAVRAGETLAIIDAREIQARLDQAQAVLQQAESELKRATSLFDQKISSQSELDSAQSKYRVANANVREMETQLAYTKITAPFGGVITRKNADVGDLATPGKPILEMGDSHSLRLEADVPEAVVDKIALGDRLPVRIATVSEELEGVVSEMSPAADPNSRTYLVKLDLPGKPGLRTGQFGRVAMPVGETSALRVPASAVVQRGQMELVFVVANGHAQLRIVKTGKRLGSEVEVVSGLNAGERIVAENAGALADRQPVEVR